MTDGKGEEKLTRSERIALRVSVIQTFLAVTGFFVGCVALYAALNESDAVRKQQQASVWPRLQISRAYYGLPGQERFDITVGNRGIGPAKVESVDVSINGKKVSTWQDVIGEVAGVSNLGISDDTLANQILSPGEDRVVFSVEEKFVKKEIIRALRGDYDNGTLSMNICYCSVFDRCWTVSIAEPRETPVKQCTPQRPEKKF